MQQLPLLHFKNAVCIPYHANDVINDIDCGGANHTIMMILAPHSSIYHTIWCGMHNFTFMYMSDEKMSHAVVAILSFKKEETRPPFLIPLALMLGGNGVCK